MFLTFKDSGQKGTRALFRKPVRVSVIVLTIPFFCSEYPRSYLPSTFCGGENLNVYPSYPYTVSLTKCNCSSSYPLDTDDQLMTAFTVYLVTEIPEQLITIISLHMHHAYLNIS